MKPICVPCQRFYRPKKTGYYFIEGMPTHNGAEPGLLEPQSWKPYKLWVGDLWECQGCGSNIVVGTGYNPISEHYLPNFADQVQKLNAGQLQVNDC